MEIRKEIINIIFLKLFLRVYDLMLELELEEYTLGGDFNGVNIKEFKFLKNGEVKYRNSNVKNAEWDDFCNIKQLREGGEEDLKNNTEIEILRTFMILLYREIYILKLMIKEIKEDIRSVEKNIDVECIFKELLTEKK